MSHLIYSTFDAVAEMKWLRRPYIDPPFEPSGAPIPVGKCWICLETLTEINARHDADICRTCEEEFPIKT